MKCTAGGKSSIWKLSGEIDHHRAQNLTQEIEQEINLRLPGTLELDFSGVSFMDSSGIALVLRTQRRMNELGGRLSVTHLPRQAARVLKTAGIHKLVDLQED
jgi:anti-anti-sigma factor